MRVSALYIYPIKSCRGLSVEHVELDRLGPLHDRRFMLVDPDGTFVTQRSLPVLTLAEVRLTSAEQLEVTAPRMPTLHVPLRAPANEPRAVQVWAYQGAAQDMGQEAADWFSTFVGRPLRLVRFPEAGVRQVNPAYAPPGDHRVAFADGYPILLISQASLDDLNTRLPEPVPMERFRPNLVVTGCEPYAEDAVTQLRIGEVTMHVVKPCERCKVTTIDPRTAAVGKEPLKTLSSYRRQGGKVLFGQNCVHAQLGTIRVGDPVEVIQ
jgi:uncharacterized protein